MIDSVKNKLGDEPGLDSIWGQQCPVSHSQARSPKHLCHLDATGLSINSNQQQGAGEEEPLPLSFLSHSLRRGWRKGSMPWMVLLPLLTTLIIIFHPATRHSMNSQYQTNRQGMKEQMLSSIPGVSFIYREPIQTTRDGLCSLLGIIETLFFSIWRLTDSLFGLTMLVHNDEVICLILWL